MRRLNQSKKRMKRWGAIILMLAALSFVYIRVCFDTNTFQVNRERFQNKKLPERTELNLLQITDVHSKVFGRDNEALIAQIRELDMDVIVLTGDLVDRKTENLSDAFYLIEQLIQINPDIYYVTGNHELENLKKEEFLAGLEKRGVTLLRNENTQYEKDGYVYQIVGVDDVSTGHEAMNAAFSNLDTEVYTILLSHAPAVVQKYPDFSADLVLSGHTHGGQVRFPLLGALVAPDDGFFPELQKGTYPLGEEQYLYIDSGLGTSELPIRFLNQSQISLITIEPED